MMSYITQNWSNLGFIKYLKNTTWMFAGQSIMIISLFINIWIARYLGPTNFGTLSYIFSFVGIFTFLTNLGMQDIVIRNLVKNPENRDRILGTAFVLMIISSVFAFVSIVILASVFEADHITKYLIIIYGLTTLLSPINIIAMYFYATINARKIAQAQIFSVCTTAIIKIFIIISGQGIIWLIATFVLEYLLHMIIFYLNYRQIGLRIKNWIFDKYIAKQLLSAAVLLSLSSAAGYMLLKIDQIMIKFMLGEESVGIYAAATKISELWYFIPGILCASLFPAIINSQKTNQSVYHNRMKHLYFLLFYISLTITIVITIMAKPIILILYGNAYIDSILILKIHIWSSIGFFISVGMIKSLTAENKLKTIFYYSILSVIVNIILNIFFIPNYGVIGAAWSTLISYTIMPSVIVLQIMKNIKYKI